MGLGVLGQQLLVELESLPADVAGVRLRDQRDPLVAVQLFGAQLAVWAFALAQAPIDESPGVARVVQDVEHP